MARKTERVQEQVQEQFDFSIFDRYTIADIMKYYAEYRNKRYLQSIQENEEYYNNLLKEIYKVVDISELEQETLQGTDIEEESDRELE